MKKRPYFVENEVIRASGQYTGRFKIGTKLGFPDSEVYLCEDLKPEKREEDNCKETLVLKAERIGVRKKSRLEMEWTLYKRLSTIEDFNIVVNYFIGLEHRFLIMKRRGIDFKQHYWRQKEERVWKTEDIKPYAIQMIEGLEKCHSCGVIHLDPKLNNYVLDAKDSNKIYLIDFDCAKSYIDSEGQHIPHKTGLESSALSGNLHYRSLNGHNCEQQSRRDDMIFLGYSLLWMARGRLPWSGLMAKQYESYKVYSNAIKEAKEEHSFEELSNGLDCLVRYMEYTTKLEFEDRPDYQYLISLFQQ